MWLTSYENTMSFTNTNEKKEKKKKILKGLKF